MRINKELLKGSTVILILSLLKRKEMYGYEIIKELEVKSSGLLKKELYIQYYTHLKRMNLYHHFGAKGITLEKENTTK